MAKKTVLLVDDDVDFLEINRIALEAAGFAVKTAHSIAEGLKIATKMRPDAAVLDVIMDNPDDGFALARQLKEDDRTKHVRIVILTSVNEVNRRRGLAFRFSDSDRDERWMPVDKVLEKPIKGDRLAAVLCELVGGA